MFGLDPTVSTYGSGILGGAASGAAAGSMFGPGYGTLIGAGVGAIAGGVGAYGQDQARKNAAKAYSSMATRAGLAARQRAVATMGSGGAAAGAEIQARNGVRAQQLGAEQQVNDRQQSDLLNSLMSLGMFYGFSKGGPKGGT